VSRLAQLKGARDITEFDLGCKYLRSDVGKEGGYRDEETPTG
jgi:hypothetical protein